VNCLFYNLSGWYNKEYKKETVFYNMCRIGV